MWFSNLNLSAIVTINSELVGFALSISTLWPNISSIKSQSPLFQLTSIACLIALSTLDEVVSYFFATLGYASEVHVQADKAGIAEDAVSTVIPDAVIYMPFAELVDVEKEIARLEKEAGRLEGEIKRAKGMLSNERFVSKAPAAKVEAEKEKLEKYTAMAAQVAERLSQLKK